MRPTGMYLAVSTRDAPLRSSWRPAQPIIRLTRPARIQRSLIAPILRPIR